MYIYLRQQVAQWTATPQCGSQPLEDRKQTSAYQLNVNEVLRVINVLRELKTSKGEEGSSHLVTAEITAMVYNGSKAMLPVAPVATESRYHCTLLRAIAGVTVCP